MHKNYLILAIKQVCHPVAGNAAQLRPPGQELTSKDACAIILALCLYRSCPAGVFIFGIFKEVQQMLRFKSPILNYVSLKAGLAF